MADPSDTYPRPPTGNEPNYWPPPGGWPTPTRDQNGNLIPPRDGAVDPINVPLPQQEQRWLSTPQLSSAPSSQTERALSSIPERIGSPGPNRYAIPHVHQIAPTPSTAHGATTLSRGLLFSVLTPQSFNTPQYFTAPPPPPGPHAQAAPQPSNALTVGQMAAQVQQLGGNLYADFAIFTRHLSAVNDLMNMAFRDLDVQVQKKYAWEQQYRMQLPQVCDIQKAIDVLNQLLTIHRDRQQALNTHAQELFQVFMEAGNMVGDQWAENPDTEGYGAVMEVVKGKQQEVKEGMREYVKQAFEMWRKLDGEKKVLDTMNEISTRYEGVFGKRMGVESMKKLANVKFEWIGASFWGM